MKYEVGDHVRIREDLESECIYSGIYFVSGMEEYRGKEVIISKIDNSGEMYSIDESKFYWSDDMLEDIEVEKFEEEIKDTDNSWLGKQYEILYFRGGSYKSGIKLDENILTVKGTLIQFESPFTGRFFIKNFNGALEIITMESVVEMREIEMREIA